LDELLAAHFQAEHADREFLVNPNVFGNVHGKCSFPHAGTRGDHDHLRGM